MKINQDYLTLVRAIKNKDKVFANIAFRKIADTLEEKQKHLRWFMNFLNKNDGCLKERGFIK